MKSVENLKIEKPYRLTRSEYMQWRNDQKAKKEIKALVMILFDKAKRWNEPLKVK